MEKPTNYYNFIDAWLTTLSEEELAAMDLLPGDDVSVAIDIWGSDVYTFENVIISAANCIDATEEEAATTLVAASATLLAIALLN